MSKWSYPAGRVKIFDPRDQCRTWDPFSWKSYFVITNCAVRKDFLIDKGVQRWFDSVKYRFCYFVILSTSSELILVKKNDARISCTQCIPIWRQLSYNSKITSSCSSYNLSHDTPLSSRKMHWEIANTLGRHREHFNGLRKRQWDRFEITLRFFWFFFCMSVCNSD